MTKVNINLKHQRIQSRGDQGIMQVQNQSLDNQINTELYELNKSEKSQTFNQKSVAEKNQLTNSSKYIRTKL